MSYPQGIRVLPSLTVCIVDINLSGASVHLDRLDPLVEACWVSGSIFIEEDGKTTGAYHSFTRDDLEVDRIVIPDLGFGQDLRPSDQRPRIVKYLIKLDFAVPRTTRECHVSTTQRRG